jgi:hypothetical protein
MALYRGTQGICHTKRACRQFGYSNAVARRRTSLTLDLS